MQLVTLARWTCWVLAPLFIFQELGSSHPEYTFSTYEPMCRVFATHAPYVYKILGTSKQIENPSAQAQEWGLPHPEGINFGIPPPLYTPHGHSRGMTAGPSVNVNGGKPLQESLPLCTRPTGTFEV